MKGNNVHNLKINSARLWKNIVDTAAIGGYGQSGVRRLTFSREDRLMRDWFAAQCRSAGCTVSIDEVGNMFALRPGRDADVLPIAMGSHLDTQPTGGRFDGILGVLAGLEILHTLADAGCETEAPLMLVNWTNEEGARFAPAMLGSGVHAGVFDRAYAYDRRDVEGVSFLDALNGIGYRGPIKAGDTRLGAMFELHIEQGPILEAAKVDIGVVSGVQAIRWYDITLQGREAHAGTTPMARRQDALVQAARIVLAVEELALRHSGLATVGQLSIAQASRNVVPGRVTLSLDLRHEEDLALERLERTVVARIGQESGGTAIVSSVWQSHAVRFDPKCLASVRSGAARAGATLREIVSGAGHDSVYISRVCPTAMIFIPCKDGLSHNPAESATARQCAIGAQVLLEAVLHHDASAGVGAGGNDDSEKVPT